jgi:16S rRNA A1518/A1519 N6-dimethyltransferase RsmA/KsgA/DIM1 with predicted DNA glycosylase/AP lyase activity
LTPYAELPWQNHDEQFFFRVVRQAFTHRRKLLRGNLLSLSDPSLSQAVIAQAFATLGLGSNARAQELTVAQFIQLSETLRQLVANEGAGQSEGGCNSLPSLSQRM